ncbi:MAG: hypothetical protein PHG66_00800 [Candidatus Colwellbacteria bacterium]|nr:hypothetical protein [Candidatus Colwellbacteria bacterium]
MSRSFSDTISLLGKIYPQKITRMISTYTVDLQSINRDNRKLEQRMKEMNEELRANRELTYFMFLSNIIPISDDNLSGLKIKTLMHNQLTSVVYRDVKWVQIPETDKCISYQTMLSDIISCDDEQYIYFITQMMNKTFPDLFVKIEDDELETGCILRVKVFWV